jgi:hypothetical protein
VKKLIGEISSIRENDSGVYPSNNDLDLEIATSSKPASLNPRSFYPVIVGIVWWGTLLTSIGLFYFTKMDPFYLIAFLNAFIITFPTIIAFTLVEKKYISAGNFLSIIKMAYSKVPGLFWLSKISGK